MSKLCLNFLIKNILSFNLALKISLKVEMTSYLFKKNTLASLSFNKVCLFEPGSKQIVKK